MNGHININTDYVRNTAHELEKLNHSVDRSFLETENIIRNLSQSWNGSAQLKAAEAFNGIKSAYNHLRFDELSRMIRVMRKASDAYELSETRLSQAGGAV